jgi:hypothetical protein
MKICLKAFAAFIGLVMLLGFRVYPSPAKWNVTPNDPKLWLRFCERPTITANDLPPDDPLYGQAVTFETLTQSVIDDFNSLSTTYVRLADQATDPSFGSADSTARVIEICFRDDSGPTGLAMPRSIGMQMVTCEIALNIRAVGSAKNYVHVLTHELGHCLGLDHPQDTAFAIMSYFNSDSRLQDDDKMGLTYLYPSDPSFAIENSTFGLSCEHTKP